MRNLGLKIIVFLFAIVMLGCSSSPPRSIQSTHSIKGAVIQAVSCDGKEETIDNCLHSAGRKCGENGFKIFSTKKEHIKDEEGILIWQRTLSFTCK